MNKQPTSGGYKILSPRKGYVKDGIGYIPLTQGMTALVDPENVEWLSRWNWHSATMEPSNCASRISMGKAILMHRVIMDAPDGMYVDHKNHNRIDNRRENLRVCTPSQNQYNRAGLNKTSKYKGVFWHKKDKRWRSAISKNKKRYYLGSFKKEEDAAKAYDKASRKMHREFGFTNFPQDT